MSFDLRLINGDLVIKDGDLDIVKDQEKLVQDILKICLTPVGSNVMNPGYGSYLSRTAIGSALDLDIFEGMAKSQLQNSLETLKQLQQIQQNDLLQKVTPQELLASIVDLQVVRNSVDFRLIDVVIKVLNRAFTRVSTSFEVSTI